MANETAPATRVLEISPVVEPEDYANHSMVYVYRRCRYLFKLEHVQGIERRFARPPLNRGSAIHVGLASRLLGQSADESAAKIGTWANEQRAHGLMGEEEMELRDIVDLARVVVERTAAVLDLGHRWETLVMPDGQPAVELTVSVPFTVQVEKVCAVCDGGSANNSACHCEKKGSRSYERGQPIGKYKRARGTVDWVARELETGAVWLVDHKSYSSFQPVENEETNAQMMTYMHLLRARYGLEPVGSITHQIRPERPKLPERNKDGSMSRSLITTDWPTYRAALLQAGLDPADYEEDSFARTGKVIPGMKAKLGEIEFWRMSRAYHPTTAVEAYWQHDFLPTVREIASKRGLANLPRSLGPLNCNGCSMRELCLESLRGRDTEFLMQTAFKLKSEPVLFDIPVLEE